LKTSTEGHLDTVGLQNPMK